MNLKFYNVTVHLKGGGYEMYKKVLRPELMGRGGLLEISNSEMSTAWNLDMVSYFEVRNHE